MTEKTSSVAASAPGPAHSGDGRRDLIAVEILLAIFVIVEITIVWLMAPQFVREFTRWQSLRYQRNGNYQAAIQKLEKLVQSPDGAKNPTYLAELGNAYLNIGNYDKSIEYYKRAQENRMNVPSDDDDKPREYADFNTLIGLGYLRKGDLDTAESYLKKGIEANSKDKAAHFYLGEIEFQRGNYLKAVDYFKFVASDPAFRDKVRDYYRRIEEALFKGVK